MKISKFLFMLIASIMMAACSSEKSDPETEAKIFGVWESTEEDDEIIYREKISYNPDHSLKSVIEILIDDGTTLLRLKISGTWSASKTTLTENFDPESLDKAYVNSFMDMMIDVDEFIKEMKKESKDHKKSKIISIGPDGFGNTTMILESDDEISEYELIEKF